MSSLTAMRAELDKLATTTDDDQKTDIVTNAWIEALSSGSEIDPDNESGVDADEAALLREFEPSMGNQACQVVLGEVPGITCNPAPSAPAASTQRPGSVHQSSGNARPGSLPQQEPAAPTRVGPSEFARDAIADAAHSMRELNRDRADNFGTRPVDYYGDGYSYWQVNEAQQQYDRGFYMENRLVDRFNWGGRMSPEFTRFYLAMGADMDWDQLGAGRQGLYWAVYETQMDAENALDDVQNALEYSNLNRDSVLGMKQELETFLERPHQIYRGYFSWNQFHIDSPEQVRRAQRMLRQINGIQ